ncbi:hypothetical protein F2Q70_00014684 [Brassica cretica]|uniref:Uncharacterized protein n=1 Tax=Brassica cretica TaxID=69181 RepID=A0A8S9HVF8_BRACR|nr:hypothetical protein F2Q70_00014684 [Brassica cretica]
MIKLRFCPSRDQSSPVKSSLGFWPSPLRSTSCFSPRILDLKNCGLSRGDPKDRGPQSVESSFFWPLWFLTLSHNSGSGWWILKLCGIIGWPIMFLFDCWFPLLEARSWQEAKSNLVTVALGKDDRIAWCWTLGPPV